VTKLVQTKCVAYKSMIIPCTDHAVNEEALESVDYKELNLLESGVTN